MNAKHLPFREALSVVAGVLGLDHTSQTRVQRPLPPRPVRVDRRALAFRYELAALDRRLRAGKVLTATEAITDNALTDDIRDRFMAAVASAYTDLDRAELLEHVADALRWKDFHERRRNP
jgi:hypothetical protein